MYKHFVFLEYHRRICVCVHIHHLLRPIVAWVTTKQCHFRSEWRVLIKCSQKKQQATWRIGRERAVSWPWIHKIWLHINLLCCCYSLVQHMVSTHSSDVKCEWIHLPSLSFLQLSVKASQWKNVTPKHITLMKQQSVQALWFSDACT